LLSRVITGDVTVEDVGLSQQDAHFVDGWKVEEKGRLDEAIDKLCRGGESQLKWIPRAVDHDLGGPLREAFQRLISAAASDAALGPGIDDFRTAMKDIQRLLKERAGFAPGWPVKPPTYPFIGMVMASFDPARFVFFKAVALRTALESVEAHCPSVEDGASYAAVCGLMREAHEVLRANGILVQDLIDTQCLLEKLGTSGREPAERSQREYSAADYVKAFRGLRLFKPDKEMLQCHYSAAGRDLTPQEMAEHLGWEDHGTANLHYGTLAHRVCAELDSSIHLQDWVVALARTEWREDEDRWHWHMRLEVATALERLGWVSGQPHVTDGQTSAEHSESEEAEAAERKGAEEMQRREYDEGLRMAREHRFLARNPSLVRDAKREYGCVCQACGFDFEKQYGELGRGFCEVHHLDPLSERSRCTDDASSKTGLDRVRVVCSNCHRMLHRTKPVTEVDSLADLLSSRVRSSGSAVD
jgi:predicted HNH restriction endonuclease